jgi:arylsulfatase A-like enzyme
MTEPDYNNIIRQFETGNSDACCSACAAESTCTHFQWEHKNKKKNARSPKTCSLRSGFSIIEQGYSACVSGEVPSDAPENAKNILFVIIDDLRANLEPYGQQFMKTPNLGRFANSSGTVTFTQAHTQSGMCVPTRASFMTGRRPMTTKIMNDGVGTYDKENIRAIHPKITTMPQHFRQSGWYTAGVGKIYHKTPKNDVDHSFSESTFTIETLYCHNKDHVWCRVDDEDAVLEDREILKKADETLRSMVNKQPFFLTVGFKKPHTPYRAPGAFFDMYPDLDAIELPKNPEFPTDGSLTGLSWYECRDMESHYPIEHTNNFEPSIQRTLRRAYYAAVSYVDDVFGQLMNVVDELELTQNTAVVVTADHGYGLGEFNHFCKQTNFNRVTNVPLIIRAPWKLSGALPGTKIGAPVELVDIFPTLIDLAGAPALDDSLVNWWTEQPDLEGKSIVPLLDAAATGSDYDAAAFNYSFSQYSRNRCRKDLFVKKEADCATIGGSMDHWTGFTVRAPHWRYTRWVTVKEPETGTPNWDDVWSEELYYYEDPLVTDFDDDAKNLAADASYGYALEDLRAVLEAEYAEWIPDSGTEVDPAPAPAPQRKGPCKKKCTKSKAEWSKKCGWRKCRGCDECVNGA